MPPAAPEPLPPLQLSATEVHALAELLRMEDSRAFDTPLVSRLLSAASPEVRARAAVAAGRVGTPAATPLLLHALDDADSGVRARAAFALGLHADSSVAVIERLGNIALGDATAPAIEAVGALGRLGVETARPFIDSILDQPRHHASLRDEALIVAWRLPRDSGTVARLAAFTLHPDAEARWRAAYSLARNGSPAAVQPLIDVAGDTDHRVRAAAVRALRVAHADSAGAGDSALATLLNAVRDSHPHVRINALRLLPGYRVPAMTTPALAGLLTDADENVAVAAAQALGETGDAAAVTALYSIATNSARSDGLRTAALNSLARLDRAAAGAVGLAWADSAGVDRWILRRHAARALALVPWDRSGDPLQRLAHDSHHLVAAEALASIITVADTLVDTRRIFLEQLAARHLLVRAAAARGLARAAGPADLDILLQAYDHARHDVGREAVLAVIEGLGRIAADGLPVSRAFYLRFGGHGAPSDPRVYDAIVERIGPPPATWRAPATQPVPQSLNVYQDVVRTFVAPVLAGAEPPLVVITTAHGDIEIELAVADAPLTVLNFLSLIESGYYNGSRWHRVVPNFVIQDGDPRGDGSGGPGYAIRDEINMRRYLRGTLGMALSGPDTGGSQFFITHSPQPHLDGGYTVFGRVRAGMDAVDRVIQEEPISAMRMIR